MIRRFGCALFLAAAVRAQAAAEAPVNGDWTRIAVVAAASRGQSGDRPLRFAYRDADRLGRMLAGVGQIEAPDLFVIKSDTRAGLLAPLARVRARIDSLKAAGRKVFLQFYYSGHGGARRFHLSDGTVPFDEVKRAMGGEAPDARVYVLDVCFGASFFNSKGFKTAPPVQLKLEMDPAARGEVTISSSSVDEQAYEVKALGGSIFTSHWIMALRGAGDRNRDGQVTLFEAYNYSYDRTSGYSAEALDRPQHPSFQMDLTGARDMTLARLLRGASGILFQGCPAGLYNVIDLQRGIQVGELRIPPGEEFTLALEPGRYRVQYQPAMGTSQVSDLELTDAGLAPLPFSAFRKQAAVIGMPKGDDGPSDAPSSGSDGGAPDQVRVGAGDAFGSSGARPEGAAPPGQPDFFRRLGVMAWAGASRSTDARLEKGLAEDNPADMNFALDGAFSAPGWSPDFGCDLAFAANGPWYSGLRAGLSRKGFRERAKGREPLDGLADGEADKYPVDLDWTLDLTDLRLGAFAGLGFAFSPRQAWFAELGLAWMSRSARSERTLYRSLYQRAVEASSTVRGEGYRVEAGLGYAFSQGSAGGRPLGLGLRFSPYYAAVGGMRESSTRTDLASREFGASLLFTVGLPSFPAPRPSPVARRLP